jgi:cytochrome b subunit of formate dehydrogenase
MIVVAGAGAMAAAPPVAAQPDGQSVAAANRRCLNCHGQPHIAQLDPRERRLMLLPELDAAALTRMREESSADDAPPTRPGLYLGPDGIASGSATHVALRCVDCHADASELPHAASLAPASCTTSCHAEARIAYERSVHAMELAQGNADAPRCASCHGGHAAAPASERESPTHAFNIISICGDCHAQHISPNLNGEEATAHIKSYLDSVHGRAVMRSGLTTAATCADCHDHHEVLAVKAPGSRTHRDLIPRTCGTCHLGVIETYRTSIHGQLLEAGDERGPVCTDCHTAHAITHANTPRFVRDIVSECGDCHDRPEMIKGRRASFYRTYRSSYHGQVHKLGSMRAARCSDCHGAHDILPISDEASRLHERNLLATCRSCHENAPAKFASFDPHADYLDSDRYPVLHAVWWYFVIVISGAMGFFGLHSLLWFIRSLIERARDGFPPRPVANPHGIERFTVLNRFNHAVLIVSFFGLTITGLPLFCAEQDWALGVSGFLGGVHVLGTLHRVFAVLLIINFVVHVIGLVQKARAHPGSILRDWLYGPNTLLPRWKDFRDCAGMFRWFVRGGRQPAFDRWTYWEKFDYLAEIFGLIVIGGSGLLLWFPTFFAKLLPGGIFNVAAIVHGYEALLAVAFIFTIHFFNAHLRAEKFPVDDVIFTGQLSEEEFREERPLEYERMVQTGRLEHLRVPVAPPWQRRLSVVIGIVAMAVGFSIVAVIVLAGIQAL